MIQSQCYRVNVAETMLQNKNSKLNNAQYMSQCKFQRVNVVFKCCGVNIAE